MSRSSLVALRSIVSRRIEYSPQAGERDAIDRIIMDELVNGISMAESVACFQRVIATHEDRALPRRRGAGLQPKFTLIINDGNCASPTPDSTRSLARAALQRAIRGADSKVREPT